VKTAIPLGTIVLIALAAAFHRSSTSTDVKPMGRVRAEAVRESFPDARPAEKSSEAVGVVVPATLPISSVAAAVKPAAASSWTKMTSLLERELGLTLLQRNAAEQMLKDRETEIKALHEAILRSGVVDIRQYDWQADLMKEAWYRKLDALLDRPQHDRFVDLVQKGFLNEGLAFTVEPGMTVLD